MRYQSPALTRRSFLGLTGAAGLAALTACAGGQSGSPGQNGDLAIQFAFLSDVGYGGYWLADDRGYYRDAHITPDFLNGGPNAPAPEVVMTSGKAQLATENNTVRLFNYLSLHNDVVIIGTQYQSSPNGLLSLAKRPVRTSADLHGVRILAGSTNRPNMDAMMKLNGVSDYSFVPAGTDVGALLQGQGDALLTVSDNGPISLEQQHGMTPGKDFVFTPFSELNFHLISGAILASRSLLQSNRAAVVGFLRATARGFQNFVRDPDTGAQLAVTKYGRTLGLNLSQQKAAAHAQVPLLQSALTKRAGLLTIDVDAIRSKVYPTMTAAGVKNLPDLATVTDTSVLAEVYRNGPQL